ncbi:hypothetical protein ACFSM5_16320 [Lacibacterium aquatile]|uniref:Uncharacterized protein n=1 Tax=Lacibacterium aquatile TaxID=1168082 RepID=A0ABW5DYF9_9PROT
MKHFLAGFLFLASSQAFAEGQYELAKPLPDCYGRSLRHTSETWVDDAEEIMRIRASGDAVTRWRNILRIALPTGRLAATFVDLKSAPDHCADNDKESYSFEGIFGRYAFVSVDGYEDETYSWIVDTDTGRKLLIEGAHPHASLTGQYLLMTETAGYGDDVPVAILDVSDQLRIARLPAYDAEDDGKGHSAMAASFVWQDATTARFDLMTLTGLGTTMHPDPQSRRTAILAISPAGIEVRVEKSGEMLSAPFKALPLDR